MFKSRIILIVVALTLILASCNRENSVDTNTRTYDDVRTDFQNLNLSAGTNDVSILNTLNFIWNFRVIMPSIISSDRPLIIALHGFSGDNTDAHKATACYIEPGFASLDAIIISPNAGNYIWEDINNQLQILSLIDLAVTYLPVDPNRIVVTGYSAGGNGSWFSGEVQPNVFSAAIPIASSYNTTTNGVARFIETPMYVIHGENDELFPLELTEGWVNEAIDAGGDITFVVAPGLTHLEPCNYVGFIEDAAGWLVNEVWN